MFVSSLLNVFSSYCVKYPTKSTIGRVYFGLQWQGYLHVMVGKIQKRVQKAFIMNRRLAGDIASGFLGKNGKWEQPTKSEHRPQ